MTDARKQAMAALFDRTAPSYENTGVDHFAELGRRLVQHAELKPGEEVLDVACGTGASLIPAAQAVGEQGGAIGIDLSPGMVERSATAVAAAGLANCYVQVADAETVLLDWEQLLDGSFDAVLCGIAMFFFGDPLRAATRYTELLRPGGRLAVSWWGQADVRWQPVLAVSGRYVSGHSPHTLPAESPFASEDSLHRMLSAAGFTEARTVEEVVETRYENAEQWWEWMWSTAARLFWERVPQESLPAAKAEVFAELDKLREPDGTLCNRSVVRFTTARTPA